MVVYRIDKASHTKASSQIKDMSAVLDEISRTLEVLQKSLDEHQKAISTPTIDEFRDVLIQMTNNGVTLTRRIAEYSQQLCTVSDQATKHLVAVDEHFGSVLREKPAANSASRVPAQVQ